VRERSCWTSVNTGRVSLSLKKTNKTKQTSRGRKKQKEKNKYNKIIFIFILNAVHARPISTVNAGYKGLEM
jgi:predicted RNA-binding protein with RPS1 domain